QRALRRTPPRTGRDSVPVLPPAPSLMSLLEPGSARAHRAAHDAALVRAMLRVELSWYDVLVAQGVASADQATLVARAVARWRPDVEAWGDSMESAGNPVVPFLAALRRGGDERGGAGPPPAGR